ncbi:MAG: AbrB/MazE/SpoVT family DNA-binding domain-containing protein [Acetobacteraceae bacterium]|nr:AbrB/MazE/SpoVT family DNA-binding domain-containing protein [Acetobacteraceae bacterium]
MQVSRWGNSLAVRLPKSLVEELRLEPGDEVTLTPVGERAFEVTVERRRAEAMERLRKFQLQLPPDYKFDREEANRRR